MVSATSVFVGLALLVCVLYGEQVNGYSGVGNEERNLDNIINQKELRNLLSALLRTTEKKAIDSTCNKNDYIFNSIAESATTGQTTPKKQKVCAMSATPAKRKRTTVCSHNPSYRTIDGTCNNPKNPDLGSTSQAFKRVIPAVYGDGVFLPRLNGKDNTPLPSARLISTTLHTNTESLAQKSTVLVMQWGQFVDHDLTGTPLHQTESEELCCTDLDVTKLHPDLSTGGSCFPIIIPVKDHYFTKRCMEFHRSAAATGSSPREQINLLTAYLDASMVYGLTKETTDSLRDGAFLKTKGDNLLPTSAEAFCTLENPDDWCFAAGDERVNVQPGLATMHTILMREHNRLVGELSKVLPSSATTADVLFEEARKIVSAIIQHITYNEWLPVIIGQDAMAKYLLRTGAYTYDVNTDPTIANVFATAAFRYGHSTIPAFLRFRGRKVDLKDMFFKPTEVIRDLDAVLESLMDDKRQNSDRFVVDQMTDHLFETTKENSFDVVALNIQRGRDHGLPSYNGFRKACGLPEVTSFDKKKFDHIFEDGVMRFSNVYNHPDDIDLFTGAMSEKHVTGGAVGPLLACLIGQQFQDIKYGDSYWHETDDKVKGFTPAQLSEIKRMSLAKLLCANSNKLTEVQQDPLQVYHKFNNPMVTCTDLPTIDIRKWKV